MASWLVKVAAPQLGQAQARARASGGSGDSGVILQRPWERNTSASSSDRRSCRRQRAVVPPPMLAAHVGLGKALESARARMREMPLHRTDTGHCSCIQTRGQIYTGSRAARTRAAAVGHAWYHNLEAVGMRLAFSEKRKRPRICYRCLWLEWSPAVVAAPPSVSPLSVRQETQRKRQSCCCCWQMRLAALKSLMRLMSRLADGGARH